MDLQRRFFQQTETWEEIRARLVNETSVYITECLRHPEYAVRIPMIRAGSGRFPRSLSASYWERVLYD